MASLVSVSRRTPARFLAISLLLFPLSVAGAANLNPLQLRLETVDNSSGGPALDGFVTNDLLIDTEDRLLAFQLVLVLEQGTIYQDTWGTDIPPPELLTESFAPSLAFDTFVATGSQYAGSPHGAGFIVGKAGDLIDDRPDHQLGGQGQYVMDSQAISITWGTTPGSQVWDVTDFLSFRITLSDDALGYWSYLSSAGFFPAQGSKSLTYAAYAGLPQQRIFTGIHHGFDSPLWPGLIEKPGRVENGVLKFPKDIYYRTTDNTPRPPSYTTKYGPPSSPLNISQVDNTSGGSALEGFVTNDLRSDFDPTKRVYSFQLVVELEQGEIYQDPLGGNIAPRDALVDLGFPSLAFDTFVAMGTDSADGPYGTPSIIGGSASIKSPSKRSSVLAFDEQELDITWFKYPDVVVYGFDDFLISRISLSDDAAGEWRLLVSTAEGRGLVLGTIENGLMAELVEKIDDDPVDDSDPLNPLLSRLPPEALTDLPPLTEGQPGSVFIYNGRETGEFITYVDDRFSKQNRLLANTEHRIPEPCTLGLALTALSLLFTRRRSYHT